LDLDVLKNGKKVLALNLKKKEGSEVLRKLATTSDVIIEPFRRGVMESLGLGPNDLMKINPRLIYARLTGFGQQGSFSKMAGHDINYVSMSGVLNYLGRSDEKPLTPVNLLADFGGGGLTCALGICLALFEREKSGKGQIIDCSMVEGTAYLSSWLIRSQQLPIWGKPRGQNILDTGAHFYETYATKDNKYISVGAIEPQFYEVLLEKLNLQGMDQYTNFEENKKKFSEVFKTKTRDEWSEIFDGSDACVTPVLTVEEAARHPHNVARNVFSHVNGHPVPNPAPKLSRTPGSTSALKAASPNGTHTREILSQLGYSNNDIDELIGKQVVSEPNEKSKM